MTAGIIELNDAGLRFGGTTPWAEESPGVAVIQTQQLLLGNDALHQARLQPTRTVSHFWHRLSTEPLAIQHPQYRHHADLAFSHLLALHQAQAECEAVIFALPGSFTREQIALLLGVVNHCPFNAVGLIDSAVAASLTYAEQPELVHVDLHLHHSIVSRLQQKEGTLTRTQVELVANSGLLALYDRWAQTIADQFIDQTRFDPLHSANTEQSLYDQLPQWLQALQQQTEISLQVADKTIKLTQQTLINAAAPLYQAIFSAAGSSQQILLGHRFAPLPGLLHHAPANTQLLPADALSATIEAHWQHIQSEADQLRYQLSLPLTNKNPTTPDFAKSPAANARPTPTHLLVAGVAHPMQETAYLQLDPVSPLTPTPTNHSPGHLSRQAGQWLLVPGGNTDLTLNAKVVDSPQAVQLGDTLQWQQGQLQGQFIHVA